MDPRHIFSDVGVVMAPSTFRQKVLDPLGLNWKLFGGGKTPEPGEVVRPDERLSWGRTTGLGFQHVFAMFGATFVFPIVMALTRTPL
jgi:hypothetical protein